MLASLTGGSDWRHVAFNEVPVADLDPRAKEEWDADAIVRAGRSHYLDWLEMAEQGGTLPEDLAECPAAFEAVRAEIVAPMEAAQPSISSTLPATSNLAASGQRDSEAPS